MSGRPGKKRAVEKFTASDIIDALFDQSRDEILIVDSQHKIVEVNSSGAAMLGYTRSEILKLSLLDLMPPEDIQQLNLTELEADCLVIRSSRLRHKDGNILSSRVEARVLSKGNFLLTFLNQSVPKPLPPLVLNHNNVLEEIVNRSPAIAFIWYAMEGWPVKFVSDNIEQFGYTAEDFYSRRVTYADLVHPDDLERVIAEVREYGEKGIDEFAQEYRIMTAEGETRWVDDRDWIHRDPEGGIEYYQGIVLDITQRKMIEEDLLRSRNMLETVLNTIPVRVFWKDLNSTYLGSNRQFARDSGLSSPEDLIGKNDHQMGWRYQADLYRADDRAVMDSGQPKLRYEEPQTTPDGDMIWLRTSKIPLQDVDGKITGILGTYEDITDFKKVEAALQESEEKFRSIVENSLAGIFVADNAYHFKYVNDELCHIMGYAPDQLIGLDFRKLVSEKTLALVMERYSKRQRGEEVPSRYEIGVVRSDGSERDAEMIVKVVKDKSGNINSIGQLVDITERKMAEQALRVSEEKFRSIFENSPAGVAMVGLDGRYLMVNPAMCEILGYSAEEFTTVGFVKFTHPDDIALSQRYMREVLDSRGKAIQFSKRYIHKDGHTIWADVNSALAYDACGEPSHFITYVIDITERKQVEDAIRASERRLSEALRVAQMGCWEYDVPGGTFIFNDQYYALHRTTAEQAGGYQMTAEHFARHYVHPVDAPTVQQAISQAIASQDENFQMQVEGRMLCADGEARWVTVWFRIEKDTQGRTIRLHGVNQDIHDHKKAEEKVLRNAARAETLARMAMQVNKQLNLNPLLESVCEETAGALKTNGALIILADPTSQKVKVAAACGLPDELRRKISSIPASIINEALLNNSDRPIVYQYSKESPVGQVQDLLTEYSIRTVAFTNISWQSQPIGALVVLNFWEHRPFDEDDISLLQALADESAQAITNARLLEDSRRRLNQLEALRVIDNTINTSLDLNHTLAVFLDQLRTQLHVDAADILFFSPNSLTLEYASSTGMRTDALKSTSLPLSGDPAGRLVLERQRLLIPDIRKEPNLARAKGFALEGFVDYFGVPLIAKGQVRGVLEIFHRSPQVHDNEWLDFTESLAGQAAISIDNGALFDELQRSNLELTLAYEASIDGWSSAMDLRDKETEGHTQRVTKLTMRLAAAMNIEGQELSHIRRGAMLHDIGKMGVPDSILLKPGLLDPDEQNLMKKHPEFAYNMLSSIKYLRPSLDIPYCHHEKWDGSGYPRGLAGERIPLAARLFAVVDVWDALTSNRPYRSSWSGEKAIEYIREQSGRQFDPTIVEVFLQTIKES